MTERESHDPYMRELRRDVERAWRDVELRESGETLLSHLKPTIAASREVGKELGELFRKGGGYVRIRLKRLVYPRR